jgi:hypothetical protein
MTSGGHNRINFKHSEITKERMRNNNNSGWFKKENHSSTQFRKGQKPWNYLDGRSKLLNPARYGDDWDKIRYLVYMRDRFTCQKCKIKGVRLDIHHKVPFLQSFDNSLGNLITLCRSCHRKVEGEIMKKIKLEVNYIGQRI